MVKIFSYVLILLIIILGISFAILNADPVTVHYYIGAKQLPLSLLLVMDFVIGLIIGLSIMILIILRAKAEIRRLRKRLRITEEEVENLRAIPIKDER